MGLNETVEMMVSEDYKERFKAEYFQLKIRFTGLKKMLEKWDGGELNFKPTCPRDLYNTQVMAMQDYIKVLELRAKLEQINLED